MNNIDNNFETKIDEINSYITEDPLKATYLIDEALLQYQYSKEYQEILNSLRNKALFQIKKNNLIAKTNLSTLELINFLKNKKMDHLFMVCYNALLNKEKDEIKQFASEFQYFFNTKSFEEASFQTLIYDFLVQKEIDYNYLYNSKNINPIKLGSLLQNDNILKIQKDILNKYEKDVAIYKIASQVFAAYLFLKWDDILYKNTKNEWNTINNVTNVFLGKEDAKNLKSKDELDLYNVFSK